MSKLEVDKIDPQSGTNLELGTSGDTITVPTGVTLDASNATTTLPANVVTTDGTQTLTNKSIAATQLTGTITPSDGTVTNAKIVDSTIELAKLSATGTKDATTFLRGDNTFAEAGGGIEVADQWRLTANITGTDGFITANLERIDSSGQGTLGTGMTESSGVFTFPSTGIYYVAFNGRTNAVGADNISLSIFTTINNSTYSEIAKCTNGFDNALGNLSVNSLIDVTDTSNVKVKFEVSSLNASSYLAGQTTRNETFMTFVRLGDT